MRRRFTLFLLLTLVVALFASGSTVLGKAPEVIEKDSALTKNKELLYYLFWTQDQKLEKDIADLQASLRLSDEQVAALKNLGLEEHQSSVGLQIQAQTITVQSFNRQAETIFEQRNRSLEKMLGDQYEAFGEWLTKWWEGEREYRMAWFKERNSQISIQADIDRISNVWATQYTPNTSSAHEVALPDKYVKFANLGWWSDIPDSIEDNYDSPEYTVNVYNPSTNIAANSVPVDEVGPWNTNDNYWDSDDGTNPRRFGADLDLGTPAATAAFYDDWNDGKDESGRTVLNPAGIDLTPSVASHIGFGTNVSGFVDVRYSDLP